MAKYLHLYAFKNLGVNWISVVEFDFLKHKKKETNNESCTIGANMVYTFFLTATKILFPNYPHDGAAGSGPLNWILDCQTHLFVFLQMILW